LVDAEGGVRVTVKKDAATRAARAGLYLSRGRPGRVLNRDFTFYQGSATVPNSFTGNQILGQPTGGAAAGLIDGIGPPQPGTPCDEPTVLDVQTVFADDGPIFFVTYNNPLSDDIYVFFNTTGFSFGPTGTFSSGPDTIGLALFDFTPPPGVYALKIIRAADRSCFAVRGNVTSTAPPPCLLEANEWVLPGGGGLPNPVGPGPSSLLTEVSGSGFTTCTVSVSVNFVFGVGGFPPTLPTSALTIIDDNRLQFSVDVPSFAGGPAFYSVLVGCADNPGCGAAPEDLLELNDA
jgi:hypothetical protein